MKETKFKQTEVGMIPSDWDVFELSQLYDITSSKRVFQKDWTSAGVPFYRAREIAVMSAGKTPEDDLFITREMFDAYTTQYGKIRENDVLITGVGTLGKVYVVKAKDEFYFKDGNIIWLQWKRKNSSLLLKLFFETNIVIDQIFGNSGGSTVATYTISNAKKTKIPLPPTIEEQQRIAKTLSDVDTLIANLEKLIAKKKNIKQGAMQQLLTGKKRLPGFGSDERRKECHSERSAKREESSGYKMTELGMIPSDWEVKTVSDVADNFIGLTYSPENVRDYGTLVLRSSNIQNDKIVYEDNVFVDMVIPERALAHDGDILVCVRNGSKALIGKSAILDIGNTRMAFGAFMTVLRAKRGIDNRYLLYAWQSNMIQDQVQESLGATINQITNADFKRFYLLTPSSIEEQTAIANVLSDMDTEIATLETKLAKYRTLKTGMMQQLLTGKIRLV